MPTTTVPTAPDGLKPSDCWRRTITGLDTSEQGARQILGERLHPGDEIDAPAGTLLLAVDSRVLRWDYTYDDGKRYAVKDARLTVHLVDDDGELRELWTRHYKTTKGAFGAATVKKLTALLAAHPAPAAAPTMIRQAKRPNYKEGRCRWCGTSLPAGVGHLVGHGEDAQVEHYEKCPVSPAKSGTPCALCGVTVAPHTALVYVVREGTGRRETRHRPDYECTTKTVESFEEYEQRMADHRAAVNAREAAERKARIEREKKAEERRRKKAAEKKAAHDAEQARVAALDITGRSTGETLFDKGLGNGVRVKLTEVILSLSDGTTSTRWAVTVYRPAGSMSVEGDYDDAGEEPREFTDLDEARDHYRDYKFVPGRGRGDYTPRGAECAECGRPGAYIPRHDSSGIEGLVCARCDRMDQHELSFA